MIIEMKKCQSGLVIIRYREQERRGKPVIFFFLVQAKMSRKIKILFAEIKLIKCGDDENITILIMEFPVSITF